MRERRFLNIVRYLLEDIVPPFARDSWAFYPVLWILYRSDTKRQASFRSLVAKMSPEEYKEYYALFPGLDTETDCNQACLNEITQRVVGESTLDVGCGRGYLANLISNTNQTITSAIDFIVLDEVREKYPQVEFHVGAIEKLPFADNSFDTVVCTHTLEHILNLHQAISELRRITKKRLIIVVPREREYYYSFNLHVHFFPYTHSFEKHMLPLPKNYECRLVDGDILYWEDVDL